MKGPRWDWVEGEEGEGDTFVFFWNVSYSYSKHSTKRSLQKRKKQKRGGEKRKIRVESFSSRFHLFLLHFYPLFVFSFPCPPTRQQKKCDHHFHGTPLIHLTPSFRSLSIRYSLHCRTSVISLTQLLPFLTPTAGGNGTVCLSLLKFLVHTEGGHKRSRAANTNKGKGKQS
jgi:hypothetical protein